MFLNLRIMKTRVTALPAIRHRRARLTGDQIRSSIGTGMRFERVMIW
jgi:hypothetical protein